MKCKYCGKTFTKNHHRQLYCSKTCSKNAKREQDRNAWTRWYYKNKDLLKQKPKWGLGSGTLGPHMHNDWNKEQKVIETELNRLKLRK